MFQIVTYAKKRGFLRLNKGKLNTLFAQFVIKMLQN